MVSGLSLFHSVNPIYGSHITYPKDIAKVSSLKSLSFTTNNTLAGGGRENDK